jgi:hypothetical protein
MNEEIKNGSEIFEYVKKNNQKVGVVVGLLDNGVIKVGWSKCNTRMDNFDRDSGLRFAKERCYGNMSSTIIPTCMKKQVRQFSARCIRYFKDAEKLVIS